MGILQDIQAGSRYGGNYVLGGGFETPLELDYSPIKQLAQYTFLYNKSQYDQRQKDADEKIKALATLSQYDAATGEGKDKDMVFKNLSELRQKGADFASQTWNNPDDKAKAWFKFQKEIGDNLAIINSATARQIKLNDYKAKVLADGTIDAAQKEEKIKNAQKAFDDTDIRTLPVFNEFKPQSADVGTPVLKETAVVKVGDNGFTEEKTKIFDPKANMNDAVLISENLKIPILPPNATDLQKQEYRQRLLRGDTNTIWQNAAQNYAIALNDPNYKKTITITESNITGEPAVTKLTDEVDYEKIKSSNPIMSGILDIVDRYNAYAEQKKSEASTVYTDEAGKKIKLLPAINADDYFIIDKSKPLSPAQIIFLEKFAKAQPDKIEKNYTNTNAAIQRENNLLNYKVQKQNSDIAWFNAHKGETKGEPAKFMDLTGYTGTLTTADIAAIDPTLVTSEKGVFQLNDRGQKATFKILGNGDVEVNYNDGKPATPKSKLSEAKPEVKATVKIINKGKYQKESVAITQTVLKDRKGEEGNPFTFTGLGKDNDKPAAETNDYYNIESNVKSRKGNVITYKDGTVWVYDEKTGTLNPKK